MKTLAKILLLGSALLPLALNSTPAAAQLLAAPATSAVEDADPALWVVKDEDTTIYLFGTVHVLKPGLSWFDEGIKTAFDASDAMMVEVVLPDDPAVAAATMAAKGIDTTGRTLTSRMTPEKLVAYETALDKVGFASANFDNFEPWLAGLLISVTALQQLGYDAEAGAEKTLTRAAKAVGKPITGFETIDEQLGFFDALPEDSQMKMLEETVAQLSNAEGEAAEMIFLWASAKTTELGAKTQRAMASDPMIADTLLHKRNARWAAQIKSMMDKPGTTFVAVGTAHLAGPKSVQEQIKALGLVATRVRY